MLESVIAVNSIKKTSNCSCFR